MRNIYEDADGNPLYRAATSSYGKPMLEVLPVGYYDKEMNYFNWNPSGVERPEELVTPIFKSGLFHPSGLSGYVYA